jgi:hypothetical protein
MTFVRPIENSGIALIFRHGVDEVDGICTELATGRLAEAVMISRSFGEKSAESFTTETRCPRCVRYSPDSNHIADTPTCRKGADTIAKAFLRR